MDAIEFVVDTGQAVSLIRKGVWTCTTLKKDIALLLDQLSGKKLVGVNGSLLYLGVEAYRFC